MCIIHLIHVKPLVVHPGVSPISSHWTVYREARTCLQHRRGALWYSLRGWFQQLPPPLCSVPWTLELSCNMVLPDCLGLLTSGVHKSIKIHIYLHYRLMPWGLRSSTIEGMFGCRVYLVPFLPSFHCFCYLPPRPLWAGPGVLSMGFVAEEAVGGALDTSYKTAVPLQGLCTGSWPQSSGPVDHVAL